MLTYKHFKVKIWFCYYKILHVGISSVMGKRYVKSDGNTKKKDIDATNFYGHSMSQMLPYDKIDMWYGHPDLYLDKLAENLKTQDDKEVGYFIEVDLKNPDDKKKKQNNFRFVQRRGKLILINIMILWKK